MRKHLEGFISALSALSEKYSLPVIFPMHPCRQKTLRDLQIPLPGIIILQPVGYMEFLELEAHAALVLTNSGGVQEEAFILNVPCVTSGRTRNVLKRLMLERIYWRGQILTKS